MAINEQNLLKKEAELIAEEKQILTELKKEEKLIARLIQNVWLAAFVVALVIIGGAFLLYKVKDSFSDIAIDKAEVSAPLIQLSAQNTDVLKNIFVHEGDEVAANTVVAQVGNELIKTETAGRVVGMNNNIGKLFNRGESVVQMVEDNELRVEARVAEDKGLQNIAVGQSARFTVDTFGSKKYVGIVDEVSPAPVQAGVAFTISDKRAVKEYLVKIRFDRTLYPELTYGMSARVWISTK